MPCHRKRKTADLGASFVSVAALRAEGPKGAPQGIPRVASGAATSPVSDRQPLGGQSLLPLGTRTSIAQGTICRRVTVSADEACGLHSEAEQSPRPDLSNETISGRAYAEPSRWEQGLAAAGIVGALLCTVTMGQPVFALILWLSEVLA